MVLALLISKVLQKAKEVATRILDIRSELEKAAAVYPKLEKIYAELQKQHEAISAVEKERSLLGLEHNELKGIKAFTKKGELQTKIDRLSGQEEQMKGALSRIVKRYDY